MDLAELKPGMSVADVGAGEGYYTVRLSPAVGRKGRVLAEDIVPEVRDSLSDRVQRENLDNVAVKLGAPDNPMLPAQSFDRVFLVHMYHEVQSPYAFLWHMRNGVKPDGLVVVVNSNRPVKRHGIPPATAQMRIRGRRHGSCEVPRPERRGQLLHGLQARRPASLAGADQALQGLSSPIFRKLVHCAPANTR